MRLSPEPDTRAPWRLRVHEVIFEAETPAGKRFDVALMIAIMASVGVVMLDSVDTVQAQYAKALFAAEWIFTILFTIEYVLRLLTVKRPGAYAGSFFGVVDLLSIVPTYLSLFFPGAQYLLVIRLLRVLRVFRVLKLANYTTEGQTIMRALRASRRKITVFMFTVLTLVTILGSLMYLIEGAENGFTSIPKSVYWSIVTLTTVGYGDIAPQTNFGQLMASVIMILGYAIIAVPTGIVTVELSNAQREEALTTRVCAGCGLEGHAHDALYCRRCGGGL
ncbi:MAG: ion transporter [Bacteroidota bacterium]